MAIVAAVKPRAGATEAHDVAVGKPLMRWWTVAILALFSSISLVDRSILLVLVPEIKAELLISDSQFGLLQGAGFAISYTSFAFIMGGLVDRFSRRWLIFGSMSVFSLAAMATGFGTSFAQLLAARAVVGIGESTISPGSQSIISDIFPRKHVTAAVSIFVGTAIFSSGLAIAVGGWLLDWLTANPIAFLGNIAPWRQVLIVAAAPGLLLALLIFTIPEPPRRPSISSVNIVSWAAYCHFLASHRRLFTGLLLGYGFAGMASYSALAWAPTYARRVLLLSPSEIGDAMGLIVGIGGVAGTFGLGFLVDRQIKRGVEDAAIRMGITMLILALPFGIIGVISDEETLFFLGLIALQCGVAGSVAPMVAAPLMVTDPRMSGRTAAMTLMTSAIMSVALGNFLVGLLTDYVFGDPMAVGKSIAVVVGVASPLAIVFLLWARKPFLARMQEPA